jgi:hypothetical protein
MLRMNQIDEIKELQRQGLGPQEIAGRLKLDRKTAAKYMQEPVEMMEKHPVKDRPLRMPRASLRLATRPRPYLRASAAEADPQAQLGALTRDVNTRLSTAENDPQTKPGAPAAAPVAVEDDRLPP